ncbi:actin-binding protein IPP-like [Vanessa tameamea]|uniref:Kelch-like protein diablo n=1 Tax=Vanessa tameamea TaxID=334116 RepID=A0A8B8IFK4_VANTA|nr:actin-binding protein IPP-like [Vanessa tameamea]XP_046965402.1 actin-binding protein IPP-like [Vanessa cardui]
MSSTLYDKIINKEGSRPYKCCEYASKVSINLNHFRRDGRFCDIDLISGKTKVKAHRVVLAASCEYFDAMFNVGLEESQKGRVVLPSVPPGILPMIIDFIYTGEIEIDKATVQHLMIAADMFQLRELVIGCGEFLKRELHPSNALGIFRFAETHNCTELAEEALTHAQANWNLVANGDELLELPLQQLITLLSSEQLKVDNEAQVLYPALKWLEYDPANRRRHCFEVLSNVRLPLISPQILDDAIKTVQDPSIVVALKTVRVDMKSGRGALVSLSAEPRARARRMLVVAGGSCHDAAPHPPHAADNILSSVLKFDLHKREWEELSSMCIARIQPGVAMLGGRVYAVGGEQGSQILANGEVYDPQTDKWSNIAPMKEARCEFGLTAWNGNLYAFGGWVGSDMGASVEVYDPISDEWTLSGRMPEPRFGMGVVNFEGLIYVVGGCTHTWRHTRDLLCYQPASRKWRALASMRHARSQAAAVVLGAHLYVIGGNAPRRTVLASVERYSFDDDSWEEVASLQQARAGCAAGAADGVLLVAGGDSECAGERAFYRARTTLSSVELYEPVRDAWLAAPPLPHSRAEAGAALL